jgi:hypothetical protein
MKTCQPHGYNPPSRCPNCRIHKHRARQNAARKGWKTREITTAAKAEQREKERKENLKRHGWLS